MAIIDAAGRLSHMSRCRKLVLDRFQDALRQRGVAVVPVLEIRRVSYQIIRACAGTLGQLRSSDEPKSQTYQPQDRLG